MYIYCDRPSKSASHLRRGLRCGRLRGGEGFNVPATVLNWGCTNLMIGNNLDRIKVINPVEAIKKAADKLLFFQAMEGTGLTPRFYTTVLEASKAIEQGKVIVCRTILNGHSGNGVVIADTKAELVPAKLYVEYVKKETEWRVHVFNGEVIDVQRKARNRDIPDEEVNWVVRNHDNGFIYMRGDLQHYDAKFIESLEQPAYETVKHLGLDFGAVDILVTKGGRVYVLEVNTAPGLEGTTLTNYVNAIKKIIH